MKKIKPNSNFRETLKNLSPSEQVELSDFAEKLARSSRDVAPSHMFREECRQSVLAKIFAHRVPFWQSFAEIFFGAKLPTAAVAIVSCFMIVFFGLLGHPTDTSARDNATIKNLSGTVWIVRNNNKVKALEGEKIYTGDKLTTESDSRAEIHFVDFSVSRLSSETDVKITKVADKGDMLEQGNKLELENGKIWTQSVKMVNSPKMEVVTPHGVVSADEATFGVEVDAEKTEVVVKENVAEVKQIGEDKNASMDLVVAQNIIEDQKIVLQNDQTSEVSDITEDDSVWIAENEIADEIYKQEVKNEIIAEVKDNAGALPGDPMYSVKQISETAKSTLTFDPSEKLKLKIELAMMRLAEAKTFYQEGREKEGIDTLRSFEIILAEIRVEAEGQELSEDTLDLMATLEQELFNILPDSPLYNAKISMRNLKAELGQTDSLDDALLYANKDLIEARKVIGKNDALTVQLLKEYWLESQKILATLESAEDFMRFVEQKNIEIQIIDKIAEKIENEKAVADIAKIKEKINGLLEQATVKLDELNVKEEENTVGEDVDEGESMLEGEAGEVLEGEMVDNEDAGEVSPEGGVDNEGEVVEAEVLEVENELENSSEAPATE